MVVSLTGSEFAFRGKLVHTMNGYDLSKQYWDFAFENPEKVTPNHAALYFFAIEHCNRLGWKEKFGFPMEMAKDAIGIKNYRTYSKTFNDLVEWGFFIVHQKSKNQYSANVIALAKNTKANTKALSKALQKHSQKQVHGIVGIIKPITNEPINQELKYPFNTELFKETWEKWKQYRKIEHKFSHKSYISEQTALNSIGKKSKTEQYAIFLIDYAIEHGWKGIFIPKDIPELTFYSNQPTQRKKLVETI